MKRFAALALGLLLLGAFADLGQAACTVSSWTTGGSGTRPVYRVCPTFADFQAVTGMHAGDTAFVTATGRQYVALDGVTWAGTGALLRTVTLNRDGTGVDCAITTLNSVPCTIVAAPGANKLLVAQRLTGVWRLGAYPYVPVTHADLYTDPNYPLTAIDWDDVSALSDTLWAPTVHSWFTQGLLAAQTGILVASAPAANQPLVLQMRDADPDKGAASTVSVYSGNGGSGYEVGARVRNNSGFGQECDSNAMTVRVTTVDEGAVTGVALVGPTPVVCSSVGDLPKMTVSVGNLRTVPAIHTAGTGYAVGDTVLLGGGDNLAILRVSTIGMGGAVTGVSLVAPGAQYSTNTDNNTAPYSDSADITQVSQGLKEFTLNTATAGLYDVLPVLGLTITGSTGNNGTYTVTSVRRGRQDATLIATVTQTIPSSVADGTANWGQAGAGADFTVDLEINDGSGLRLQVDSIQQGNDTLYLTVHYTVEDAHIP